MEHSTPFIPYDYFKIAVLKRKKLSIPPIQIHNLDEGTGVNKYPLFRELFKDVIPEIHVIKHGYELAGIEKIIYEEEPDYQVARLHTAHEEIAVIKKQINSERRVFMYDGPGGFVIWFLSKDNKVKYIFPSNSHGYFEDLEIQVTDYICNPNDDPTNANLINTFNKPVLTGDAQHQVKNAVILATGPGHLTSPISGNLTGVAKYAIPIHNKPLISYVIDTLKVHHLHNIIVNTHTLPHSVENAVTKEQHHDTHIKFRYEDVLKGTAVSILKNRKDLEHDHFMVIQGDVITNFDISKIIKHHIEYDAAVTICLYPYMQNPRFGYAAIDNSERINGSGKILKLTTDTDILTKNMVPVLGCAIFSPRVWKYIDKAVKKLERGILNGVDLEFNIIYDMVRSNENVRGEIINGYWHHLDSIKKYCDLSQIIDNHMNLQSGKLVDRKPIIWEGAENLLEQPSQIGGNVIVIQ